jgi:uncharacterized protein YecT (DUF1311 family)
MSASFSRCIDRSNGVTVEMRNCAADELDRLDRILNDAYRQRMSKLSPPRRVALQFAERTWVKRRRAYCESFVTPNGGTAQLLDMDNCFLNTTVHRTLFIRRFR